MSKLVIGFGTGRCGTKSLSKILSTCTNCCVLHEGRYRGITAATLPWKFDKRAIDKRLNLLSKLEGDIIGDIALYYLNYLGYISRVKPKTKFIFLYRKIDEVSDSFIRKTGRLNHWQNSDRKDHRWNKVFPTYSKDLSKKEAIKKYCRKYNETAYRFIKSNRDKCILIPTKRLNDRKCQRRLYRFLKVPKKYAIYSEAHENKSQCLR